MFSNAVDNVYLSGADGELGVLQMHAGLVTAHKPGVLHSLRRHFQQGGGGAARVGALLE